MKNKNKRKRQKISRYIILCVFTAVILSVSTYAWFVGLQDVKVSSFDVTIKSADSLLLSLDGKTFKNTVDISNTTYSTSGYSTHNSWGILEPLSSVGAMDAASGNMILYEKASLTASPIKATTDGGYRLLASKVNNYTLVGSTYPEAGKYVAFDIFVKNNSGEEYYSTVNILNEEAIYLTTDSQASVGSTGVENTGIENSVRVAFAQIGRVNGGLSDISGIMNDITCTDDSTKGITGICNAAGHYTATIWEPNDMAHVAGAISWYTTSCSGRNTNGDDLTKAESYNSTECEVTSNPLNGYYTTYAVNKDITINTENGIMGVDTYDGHNGYSASIGTGNGQFLTEMDYFTDTEKMQTGTDRPTFFTLAPNSITKVRVYVWIEGQDIDNYDYAAAGKSVKVSFGFTKERFEAKDVNYSGPILDEEQVKMSIAEGDSHHINLATCEANGFEVRNENGSTWCYMTYKEAVDLELDMTNVIRVSTGRELAY